METNSSYPEGLARERNSNKILNSFIYAGRIALVDFGGEFPNGNDVDPNLAVAVVIIGSGAIKLAQHLI